MSTCVVGCKLPHGLLIELMIGGKLERVQLNGNNAKRIIGGYGLTQNVPLEPFQKWMAEHKDFKYVRNKHVFIETTSDRAESMAKELRNEKSARTGMEPLNPFARDHKLQHGLTTDEERAARRDYDQQRANNPDRNRQISE